MRVKNKPFAVDIKQICKSTCLFDRSSINKPKLTASSLELNVEDGNCGGFVCSRFDQGKKVPAAFRFERRRVFTPLFFSLFYFLFFETVPDCAGSNDCVTVLPKQRKFSASGLESCASCLDGVGRKREQRTAGRSAWV